MRPVPAAALAPRRRPRRRRPHLLIIIIAASPCERHPSSWSAAAPAAWPQQAWCPWWGPRTHSRVRRVHNMRMHGQPGAIPGNHAGGS